MKNILCLTLSTICVYLHTDVSALMCYECNTRIDLECSNLDKMSIHYHICDPPKAQNNQIIEYRRPLCRKIEQKIKVRNNLIVQKHSCGWELYQNKEDDLCYQSRNEDYEETVCQCFSDGCNASRQITAHSVSIFIFSILSLSISHFSAK